MRIKSDALMSEARDFVKMKQPPPFWAAVFGCIVGVENKITLCHGRG